MEKIKCRVKKGARIVLGRNDFGLPRHAPEGTWIELTPYDYNQVADKVETQEQIDAAIDLELEPKAGDPSGASQLFRQQRAAAIAQTSVRAEQRAETERREAVSTLGEGEQAAPDPLPLPDTPSAPEGVSDVPDAPAQVEAPAQASTDSESRPRSRRVGR